ncbi:Aminomethyltransferase folate-binding domain-containing protein [Pseudovirgaria hyperparasitica]|uniref:Iron-sulfur cluster assembly factor IBA57 homolog, mitochondrial n=1 Tax=Pseudovirgaria hyperparasitica TaxID=470096 RepID=A0A6A6WID0_9PEZI|nr:Aminomethyltransferase folate-binding domain-containing protein [Pseudovirgaria hyperparasitica]KAF2762553.1 Aminomethyltransferase folate-binding domain-containing protein [Pseudovirgaria hyperparasitica]
MSLSLSSAAICNRCLCQQAARRFLTAHGRRSLSFVPYNADTLSPQAKSTRPRRRAQTTNGVLPARRFSRRSALREDGVPSPQSLPQSQSPARPLPTEYRSEGFVHLHHRRLISITGRDTAKFLQGLVTANIKPEGLFEHGLVYTAFLNAQGRLLADVLLHPWPNDDGLGETLAQKRGDGASVFVEVDDASFETLLKHLRRHKLRSKINIEPVNPDDVAVYHMWSPTPPESTHQPSTSTSISTSPDPRFAAPGPSNHRCLRRRPDGQDEQTATVADYTLHRYIHGIPEGPTEIPPSAALPLESNIDLLAGIDFHKGCYVGQELTIRTKHTGVVRKRILPVLLSRSIESAPIDVDTLPRRYTSHLPSLDINPSSQDGGRNILAAPKADAKRRGRPTGKLLGAVGNIGLALCRLEKMTDLQVSAEAAEELMTEPVTQLADEEDVLGGPVYVKAVVPRYVRQGIEDAKSRKQRKSEDVCEEDDEDGN